MMAIQTTTTFTYTCDHCGLTFTDSEVDPTRRSVRMMVAYSGGTMPLSPSSDLWLCGDCTPLLVDLLGVDDPDLAVETPTEPVEDPTQPDEPAQGTETP